MASVVFAVLVVVIPLPPWQALVIARESVISPSVFLQERVGGKSLPSARDVVVVIAAIFRLHVLEEQIPVVEKKKKSQLRVA